MKNTFKILSIEKKNNRLDFNYEVKGDWQKYFELSNKMFAEYSCNIENVPDSIAVIPLIGNILPIIWLLDATLYINEIDQNFLDHINDIKSGFETMYPMLSFKGKICVKHTCVNNNIHSSRKTALFFSGGVDAFTTLFRHMNEKPQLITIWGADVKLSDIAGWKQVQKSIQKVALDYELSQCNIKSNFRQIICEGKLNNVVKKSKDGYWHGFQCGMSIITLAAPIAFIDGLLTVYIASSFPSKMKGQYTCGSDPLIDNNIFFGGCRTFHDGYELDRQEKVRYIIQSKKAAQKPVSLRVCWISSGGKNCCKCDKCYRTILEIISEGEDPNTLGFEWADKNIRRCKRKMMYVFQEKQYNINQFYPPIQENLKLNWNNINDAEKYKWLLDIDFEKYNEMHLKNLYNSILFKLFRRIIAKIYRIIKGV